MNHDGATRDCASFNNMVSFMGGLVATLLYCDPFNYDELQYHVFASAQQLVCTERIVESNSLWDQLAGTGTVIEQEAYQNKKFRHVGFPVMKKNHSF
mmetsp:Transcript_13992/g.19331  ORF Transcript_13992/g.19331 Transcript_13992/m.19331 type:complete len:97 (-) Transcript_13992:982-1272(-)